MSESTVAAVAGGIHCTRHDRDKPVADLLSCPYCRTRRPTVVAAGDRQVFCDYDAARDPIVFGFPDGSSRYRSDRPVVAIRERREWPTAG